MFLDTRIFEYKFLNGFDVFFNSDIDRPTLALLSSSVLSFPGLNSLDHLLKYVFG